MPRFDSVFSAAVATLFLLAALLSLTFSFAPQLTCRAFSQSTGIHSNPVYRSGRRRGLVLINLAGAHEDDSNDHADETDDERWNRLLRERIEELEMTTKNDAYDNVIEKNMSGEPEPLSNVGLRLLSRIGSLELLAFLVSAFFVATVVLSDGAILATPPPSSSTSSRSTPSRVMWNADEVLRQDFARESSSVQF